MLEISETDRKQAIENYEKFKKIDLNHSRTSEGK